MHKYTGANECFFTGRHAVRRFLLVELALVISCVVVVSPLAVMHLDGVRITGHVTAIHGDRAWVQDPSTELEYVITSNDLDLEIGQTATIVADQTGRLGPMTPVDTYLGAIAWLLLMTTGVIGWPVCWWGWRRHLRLEPGPPTSIVCAAMSGLAWTWTLATVLTPAFGQASKNPRAFSGDITMAVVPGLLLLVALLTNRSWKRPDLALGTSLAAGLLMLATTLLWALEAG